MLHTVHFLTVVWAANSSSFIPEIQKSRNQDVNMTSIAFTKARGFLKRLVSCEKSKSTVLEKNELGRKDHFEQGPPTYKSIPTLSLKALESESSKAPETNCQAQVCHLHCQIDPETGKCVSYQTIHRSLSILLSPGDRLNPDKWHLAGLNEQIGRLRPFLFYCLCQEYSIPDRFAPTLPRKDYNGFLWIANLLTQYSYFRANKWCHSPNRTEVAMFWDQHVYRRLLRLFSIPCKVLGLTDSHAEQLVTWFGIREIKSHGSKKTDRRDMGSCVSAMIKQDYRMAVKHRLNADKLLIHTVVPCTNRAATSALLSAVHSAEEQSVPSLAIYAAANSPRGQVSLPVKMPNAVSLAGARFDGRESYSWCEKTGIEAKGRHCMKMKKVYLAF
jgi:hypothetical protein